MRCKVNSVKSDSRHPALFLEGTQTLEPDIDSGYLVRDLLLTLRSFYPQHGMEIANYPYTTKNVSRADFRATRKYYSVTDSNGDCVADVVIESRPARELWMREIPGQDFAVSSPVRYFPRLKVYFNSKRDEDFVKRNRHKFEEAAVTSIHDYLSRKQRDMCQSHLETKVASDRRARRF